MAEVKKVSDKALKQMLWRQYPILAYFNYEKQQAGQYCYAMIPVLKELYPEGSKEMKEALIRHNAFFNTSPPLIPFVMGITAAMEEEYANAPDVFDEKSINATKAALMGPLAGIGDSLFWGTFRIIGVGIGAAMAIAGNPLGPILYALINIIPATIVRFWGLDIGYKGGRQFLSNISASGMMNKATEAAKIMGLIVVGYMIASMVSVSTPLQFDLNGSLIVVQDIFDAILPNMLPLATVFGCYALLQKGVKSNWLIIVLIIAGVLLHIIGIL